MMRNPCSEYRITAKWGLHERHLVWDGRKPLALDFPIHWKLETCGNGLQIREDGKKPISVPSRMINQSEWISIPQRNDTVIPLQLKIASLKRLHAAHAPSVPLDPGLPQNLMSYSGVRTTLVKSCAAPRSFDCYLENRLQFSYLVDEKGHYRFTVYQPDLTWVRCSQPEEKLEIGDDFVLSPEALNNVEFRSGYYWWRFSYVPHSTLHPNSLNTDPTPDDSVFFRTLCKRSAIAFFFILSLLLLFPNFPKKENIAPTVISLKKPKTILNNEPRLPSPVQVAAKPLPPRQPAIEPQKKMARKRAKKAPPHRQAKRLAPPPKSVSVPIPALAKTSPSITKRAPQNPNPTVSQAAQVTQSLSFLSSPTKASSKNISYSANSSASTSVTALPLGPSSRKGGQYLASLGQIGNLAQGSIQTIGIRGVSEARVLSDAEGTVAGGGQGKGLNKVLGKVSLNSLYGETSNGGGDEVGAAIGGGGISLGGSGSVDEKQILMALAKRLDRFQYCYEKALLADPSLSGNVMMEWTLQESGGVSGVKVVKSQLNHKGLHHCVSKEISLVKFPPPKGGSVNVKYPFNFASSSL